MLVRFRRSLALAVLLLLVSGVMPTPAGATVTFNKDIAPIVFANCASCHRPGEVAPFPLLSYSDVRRHAKEIGELTHSRTMPPWKAEPGFGDFAGVRRLTEDQIALIQQWVKSGRPEGDPGDLPALPKFPSGWKLGEPDLVVKMPRAYTLRADGSDDYRCFVIPLNLTEDKCVTAVEFRAGNPKIVHHSLFFLDTTGRGRELEAESADGQPGYYAAGGPRFRPSGGLGGWAPGVLPQFLPDGVGRLLRAGSDLVLQIHFHPSGKIEHEQSMVGLYFAKAPPRKLMVTIAHGNNDIDIAPGDSHYVIDDSFTLPSRIELVGIFPHAHLLCRQIKVSGTLPDGSPLPLIWIKDWDWNWQGDYFYTKPIEVPPGTKVRQEFTYDNSAANIHNPNSPPKRVVHGEQTGDEMSLIFYDILVDRAAIDRMQKVRDVLRQAFRPTTRPATPKND